MKDLDLDFQKEWIRPVIRVGMFTLLLAIGLSFTPTIYLAVRYGVLPPLETLLLAWGMIAALFGAFYIVEPVSYYSILGLSGTYLSFLAGNISTLRLPCAAMALEATDTKEGTPQAEVVATLGITGSVMTNLIGITLTALVGAALLPLVPTVIADTLRLFVVPAIFGAVYGQFSIRYPKLAVVGIAIPVILRLTIAPPLWVLIIASVFGTILVAKLLYAYKRV